MWPWSLWHLARENQNALQVYVMGRTKDDKAERDTLRTSEWIG